MSGEYQNITWAQNIRDFSFWIWSWLKYILLLFVAYLPPFLLKLNLLLITLSIILMAIIGFILGAMFPREIPSIYLFEINLENATIEIFRGAFKHDNGGEYIYISNTWKRLEFNNRNYSSPFWVNASYPVHLVESFYEEANKVIVNEASLHSYSAFSIAMLQDIMPNLAKSHIKAMQDKASYEKAGSNFLVSLAQRLHNAQLKEIPSPEELLRYLNTDNENDNQSDNNIDDGDNNNEET